MTIEKLIEYVIGYKTERIKEEEIKFDLLSNNSIRIDYLGMKRDFEVEGDEWFPLYWKDEEEEDTYISFHTDWLMKEFSSFARINFCTVCEGEGYYEKFIECGKPASSCCGSCTKTYECDCETEDRIFPY